VPKQAISRPLPSRPAEADDLTFVTLLEGWSDRGRGSLANRLAFALKSAVQSGLLAEGTRLPSERALATDLAVSRATVTNALDELRADGTLVSRQGSGTVVAGEGAIAPFLGTARVAGHFTGSGPGIDLATGNPPDASHLPSLQLDVTDLITDGEGPGTQPLGLPALRAALAERHTAQGLVTFPEQIHITAGAHQATSITLRTCAGRGACIAVEETSYPGIFDVIDGMGAIAVPVARDSAGIRPESLDEAFAKHGATAVYLQSGPHNPTGRLAPASRVRALAEVLDAHKAQVVDDIALDELAFDRRPRPRLAQLCRQANVFTVCSVSKVTWGGLRVGWIRASEPMIERTLHVRLGFDLGASVPAQIIVLRLLPELDPLAEQRRATLTSLVERAIALFATELPEFEIEMPQGGSVLWVKTPAADTTTFCQLAARHGVKIAPGSVARADRAADPHVRVCVDRPWPLVEEGIRRLAVAWSDLTASADPVLG
jgi:DNA-binding transcriptional MocR family regulator